MSAGSLWKDMYCSTCLYCGDTKTGATVGLARGHGAASNATAPRGAPAQEVSVAAKWLLQALQSFCIPLWPSLSRRTSTRNTVFYWMLKDLLNSLNWWLDRNFTSSNTVPGKGRRGFKWATVVGCEQMGCDDIGPAALEQPSQGSAENGPIKRKYADQQDKMPTSKIHLDQLLWSFYDPSANPGKYFKLVAI